MSTTALVNADTFTVRRATVEDINALIVLRRQLLSGGIGHYAARSETEDQLWQGAYRVWLGKHIREKTERICIAVTEDGEGNIVACATGIIDERAPMNGCLNGLMGWVQSVVVAPEWRRKGLGVRTMNFLLRWFEKSEAGKVALQTTPSARGLYEHLAFRPSGEDVLIRVSN